MKTNLSASTRATKKMQDRESKSEGKKRAVFLQAPRTEHTQKKGDTGQSEPMPKGGGTGEREKEADWEILQKANGVLVGKLSEGPVGLSLNKEQIERLKLKEEKANLSREKRQAREKNRKM